MGRTHVRTRRGADASGYGFTLAELAGLGTPLIPHRLFGGAPPRTPLEVEIGSGKGTFLIAEGGARPDTLFLGVERARRYWLYAADRLRRREQGNVRLLHADALEALAALSPDTAAALHVYFPDPWPKRRHRHRRLLLHPSFLTEAERVMRPGAALRVVTDDREYFARIREALAARRRLIPCPYRPPLSAGPGEFVGTNFERKYRAAGRVIFAVAACLGSANEDDALPHEESGREPQQKGAPGQSQDPGQQQLPERRRLAGHHPQNHEVLAQDGDEGGP